MSRFLKSVIAIASSLITAAVPVSASAASALDLNLPSLGSTADAGLSPQDEYRLGTQLMAQVRADPTYLADPEIMDYLGRLGYQLVSHARSSTYNFFFFPISTPSHSPAATLPSIPAPSSPHRAKASSPA